MSIVYSHIPVDLKSQVFLGPYSHIPVDLAFSNTPPVLCPEMWQPKLHNEIDFNFNVLHEVDVPYNGVNFTFDCAPPPEECEYFWKPYPGDAVNANINKPWVEYGGSQVNWNWTCSGVKPPVLFPGFITSYEGSTFAFDLDTSLSLRADTGENLDVVVTTFAQALIEARANDGGYSSAAISTEQSVEPRVQEGAVFKLDIKTFPIVTPEPRAWTGEVGTLNISTTHSLEAAGYTGESVKVDLKDSPAPEMFAPVFTGESLIFNLSTTQPLGLVRVQEGAAARVTGLDELGFYRAAEGSVATVSLATDTTFAFEFSTGEFFNPNIRFGPSEPLGRLRAADGNAAAIDFKSSYVVHLYPERIGMNSFMRVNPTGYVDFDLGPSCICGGNGMQPDGTIDVEMGWRESIGATPQGDRVYMTASLSCLPRFSAKIATGESFRGVDPVTLEVVFGEATGASVSTMSFDHYDFRLCPGNLIPDGDYVNVELVSEYNDDCDVNFIYTGEAMDFTLQQNWQTGQRNYTGESCSVNLTTSEAISVRFTSGEYARVSNPEFSLVIGEGAVMRTGFVETPILGYEGTTMTFDLSIEYFVEFLESGCLDNEFVPANENGDPDWDKFRPVPVEMDRYLHAIKARCY